MRDPEEVRRERDLEFAEMTEGFPGGTTFSAPVLQLNFDRFARSYYKCRDGCTSHDYHLRSVRQMFIDYEAEPEHSDVRYLRYQVEHPPKI